MLTNVLFSVYPAGVCLCHYRRFDLDLLNKSQITFRSSCPEGLYKISVLKHLAKFRGKHYVRVNFLIKLQFSVCNFSKNETVAQAFYSEF